MMVTKSLFSSVCLAALLHSAPHGLTAELPVETFFRNYEYRDAKISPDGDYLAALAPDGPRVGLAIVNLMALKANWAAGFKQLDISSFFWLNNDRLLFYLSEDGYAQGGIYAVNRDGTKLRELVPLHQFHTGILDLLGGASKEILVESLVYAGTWI